MHLTVLEVLNHEDTRSLPIAAGHSELVDKTLLQDFSRTGQGTGERKPSPHLVVRALEKTN